MVNITRLRQSVGQRERGQLQPKAPVVVADGETERRVVASAKTERRRGGGSCVEARLLLRREVIYPGRKNTGIRFV